MILRSLQVVATPCLMQRRSRVVQVVLPRVVFLFSFLPFLFNIFSHTHGYLSSFVHTLRTHCAHVAHTFSLTLMGIYCSGEVVPSRSLACHFSCFLFFLSFLSFLTFSFILLLSLTAYYSSDEVDTCWMHVVSCFVFPGVLSENFPLFSPFPP